MPASTTPQAAPTGSSSIVHRRAFEQRLRSLSPTYTHLAPSVCPDVSTVLLPADSTALVLSSFDSASAPTLLPITSESDTLTALAHTPDSRLAILAHRSGNVRIHLLQSPSVSSEIPPPRTIRPFRETNVVTIVAVHPSSRYVALASADGAIRVHDLVNLSLTHALATGAALTALTFGPNHETTALLAGCDDGAVRLFDLSEKRSHPVAVVRPHVARVSGIAFVDEQTIVSVSPDGTLALLSLDSADVLTQNALLAANEPLATVAPLSDGRVAVASPRGKVRIWNVANRTERTKHALELPFVRVAEKSEARHADSDESDDEDGADAVAISQISAVGDDNLLVVLSDQTLLSMSAPSNGCPVLRPFAYAGNLEEVYDVVNVSKYAVAVASNSSTIWVFNTPRAESAGWRPLSALVGHGGNVLSLACVEIAASSPFGAIDCVLASGARDHVARVWGRSRKTQRWASIAVGTGHTDAVSAVALSPKLSSGGAVMVSGGGDRTLKLWKLDSALRKIGKLFDKDEAGQSPDFHVAGSVGDEEEPPSAPTAWTCLSHEKDINAVAFSPDGRLVASGSQDRTVKLWNAESGSLHVTCTGHRRGVWSVAFSPVDRIVVSASGDTTIRVWNVASGACLRTLQGHLGGVLRARFISRGTQIASTGADGLVKVWTTKSGECDTTLDGHEERVWGLETIDDGDKVLSAGADGHVRIWSDMTEEQEREAVRERERDALLQQEVENAARARKWGVAARGALELNMTNKLKTVLSDLIVSAENPTRSMGELVAELISGKGKKMGSEESEKARWALAGRLFLACRDWNASGGPKSAAAASYVLQALFTLLTPEELCDNLPVEKRLVVEALEAHCGRHLQRVDELFMKHHMLEYTLTNMMALSTLEQDEPSRSDRSAAKHVGAKDSATPNRRKRKPRSEVAAEY